MRNAFCITPPRSSIEDNIENALENEAFATIEKNLCEPLVVQA